MCFLTFFLFVYYREQLPATVIKIQSMLRQIRGIVKNMVYHRFDTLDYCQIDGSQNTSILLSKSWYTMVPKRFGFLPFWGNSGPVSGQKLTFFAHCKSHTELLIIASAIILL